MEILGLIDVPLAVILLSLALLLLYLYGRWTFGTWKSLGVPGPEPSVLLGNLGSFRKLGEHGSLELWRQTFGHTYGIYFNRQPVLVTSDKDIMKEVLVKQFNNFVHRFFPPETLLQNFVKDALFFSNGSPWKRYRHLMTPAFSSGKLKALLGYMDKCSCALLEVLKEKEKSEEDVDLKDLYGRFTVDVIAGTAFGLDTNAQQGQEEEQQQLVKAMKDLTNDIGVTNISFLISGAFPFLAGPMRFLGCSFFPKKAVMFYRSALQAIVQERDQKPTHNKDRVDFLQQMMAYRRAQDEHVTNVTHNGKTDNDATDKHLSDSEVLSQGFIVFIAGFETTASTLRYLTYSLATNPDVQENLFNEISDVIGDGDVTYEKLAQMTYLDCVISETLRMYPPLSFYGREAEETVTIKGVTIPKGAGVIIPVYNITHNPEFYPEPDKFRPDRFQQEQDSMLTSLPFGFGPRQCIGMRLALLEVKVAAVHVFRKLKVVPCDKTPESIKFAGEVLLQPDKPLIVRTVSRA